MVQRVERFAPQLQAVPFRNLKILERGEIYIPCGGSPERVASRIPKGPRAGGSKRRYIEPPLERSLVGRQIRADARCIQTIGFRHNDLACSIPADRIEWAATLRRVDAGDLPAADDGIQGSVIYRERFPFSHRQFVLHRPYQTMGRIE